MKSNTTSSKSPCFNQTHLSAIIASVLCTGPALAQSPTADNPLEEVIVTATKRGAQLLQDVPTSVGVLSAQTLEHMGAAEMADLTNAIVGLDLVDRGPGNKEYIIRGLRQSGASGVSLYIDNMPTSGAGEDSADLGRRQAELDLYDVQQVEVLRGPQGTTYGQSALAGVIKFVLQKPDASGFDASMLTEAMSYQSGSEGYSIKGMVNIPLIADRLALRAVAHNTQYGGYVDNTFRPESNVNDGEQQGFRLSALFHSSEDSSLLAQFIHQRTEMNGLSKDRVKDTEFTNLPQENFRLSDGSLMERIVPADGEYKNRFESPELNESELSLAGLTYEHQADAGTFTIAGSYYANDVDTRWDMLGDRYFTLHLDVLFNPLPPGTIRPVPDFLLHGSATSQTALSMYSFESRFASSFSGPWNFLAGVFYQQQDINLNNLYYETASSGSLEPVQDAVNGIWFWREADFSKTHVAGFGEVYYDVTDRLQLMAGVRSFNTRRRDTGRTYVGFLRFGVDIDTVDLTDPTEGPQNDSSESNSIFKGQISYRLTEDILTYFQVAQGFREGGPINQVQPNLPAQYDSDRTINYELGFKSQLFENRLTFNAAVYMIDWYDMQVEGTYDLRFDALLNLEGKNARAIGTEIETLWRPIAGLELGLNIGYNDTELLGNYSIAQPGGTTVLDADKGDPLLGVAKESYSTSVQYIRPLGFGPDLDLLLRADLQYRGEIDQNSYSDDNYPSPDYSLLNLRMGIEAEKWGLYLYGRNVLNERAVYASGINLSTLNADIVGPPRSLGVSFNYRL